jgi:pimeloyl-ACP methyl ester carboxylesterase
MSFAQRRIDVAGRALACAESGSGAPVVCIGPGPSRAHDIMAEGRRVILFAAAETAQRVGAALQQLGIAGFDLMAHGEGAAAALQLALAQGEAVHAIALVAPGALADDPRLKELKTPILALFGTKDASLPPDRAGLYRTALGDCNLMFVYEAGAAIDVDRPEAVASIALEFFERKDLFLVNRESGLTFP